MIPEKAKIIDDIMATYNNMPLSALLTFIEGMIIENDKVIKNVLENNLSATGLLYRK